MSKGKYKRKKKHSREEAKQERSDAVVLDGIVNPKTQAEASQKRTANTGGKHRQPMKFSERIKQSTLTDWLLVVFTGVLAAASIYQFTIMGSQLTEMRKDQRPWIKLSFDNFIAQANQPVSGTLHIVNNGKTPAKGIYGGLAIEKVTNGEQPTFEFEGRPHVNISTGTIFPNDPVSKEVTMQKFNDNDVTKFESQILSKSDWEDYSSLKIFFVSYGVVYYSDFSGIKHFTKFCAFVNPPPTVVGTVTARDCTAYNDVDDN